MNITKRFCNNISNYSTRIIQRVQLMEDKIKQYKEKYDEERKKRKELYNENRELCRTIFKLEHQNDILTEKLNGSVNLQNDECISVQSIIDYAIDLDDKDKAFVVINLLNELYNGINKREAVKQIRDAYKSNKTPTNNYFIGDVKKVSNGVEYNIEGNYEDVHNNGEVKL